MSAHALREHRDPAAGVDERDAVLAALLLAGDLPAWSPVALDEACLLAVLRPLDGAEGFETARRLRRQVRTVLEAYRSRAATARVGESVYVCLPVSGPGGRAGALRALRSAHESAQVGLPHRGAVTGDLESWHGVPSARQVLDGSLSVAQARGWGGLTDTAEVEAAVRLQQLGELVRAHPHVLQGRLGRVVDYDGAHGGDLVATLREWFDSNRDPARTATRLGLHVNTVRYRLRRVQEVAGIRLDDPDERLLVELQVRLLGA